MSNTDQAPEPSMEEILSSIRRIISDDNEASSAEEEVMVAEPEVEETPAEEVLETKPEPETETQASEETPQTVDIEDDDIFELTNVVEAEEPPATDGEPDMAGFEVETTQSDDDPVLADCGADVEDDIEFVSVETEEPDIMALPEMGPEPVFDATADMKTDTDSDMDDRLVSEDAGVAAASSFGDLANMLLSRGNSASTLEELVQEMLRPMLKSWLDANLPDLVEKLVSEEIERIARRGR